MVSGKIHDPYYPQTAEEIAAVADSRKFIPTDIFPTVRKWAYTPTADFILTRYGPRGFEFLLAKRQEAPWAGQWFFGGGRILPGEVPVEGMMRGCSRELGFVPEAHNTHFLLWQSIYNPECVHGGEPYFCMSGCWQIWVDTDAVIVLDSTWSESKWFTMEEAADTTLSVYVEKAVKCLKKDPARDYHME